MVSGLTGIGGGVLMVPFLYALYDRLGVARDTGTILAHATSLAVIVPAALRGLHSYRGSNLVQWRSALPIGIAGGLSSLVTAQLVTGVPAGPLRVGFGVFLVVMSADLLLRRSAVAKDARPGRQHLFLAALVGIPVGALSAALGIGGGVPATLAMLYILHVPFRQLAPTSLAFIVFTAAAGSLGYLLSATPALPFGGVVGHVDLGHGLPLALGAVALAPVGVRLNKRLPVMTLRRVFGALLLVLGVTLVVQNL